MSDRLRLWNRFWDPVWDSDKAPFGVPAYPFVATWINATIDYSDGSRWVGRLERCPEGIRRETYLPDEFQKFATWPEPCLDLTSSG